MLTVRDVLACVEEIAPPELAYGFDHVGLQVGDPDAPVTKVVTSLDSSLGAISYTGHVRAQVLVSHHPVVWDPMRGLSTSDYQERRVFELVRGGVALIAAHTNWDCARGGVNCSLAEELRLKEVVPFGGSATEEVCKLVTFVPPVAKDAVARALAKAGAGRIGNYSDCTFSAIGTGTFLAGEGSSPAVGSVGGLETVAEERLETIVPTRMADRAVAAVRAAHPYEEPAIDLVVLRPRETQQIGRTGRLAEPLPVGALGCYIDQCLGCRCQVWGSVSGEAVSKVAVVGGAAAGEWRSALAAGAQAFVTGEVPQHTALEASESGLTMVAAGHYHTEHPGMARMAVELRTRLGCDISVYEPEPGSSGRPF